MQDRPRHSSCVPGRDGGHERQREPEAVGRRVGAAAQLRGVDRAVADDQRRDADREHRRAEHREAVGHLGDHQHDRQRRMGDAAEEGHHRHDHEGRRDRPARPGRSARAGARCPLRAGRRSPCPARRCRPIRPSRSTARSRGSSRTAARGRPTAAVPAASSDPGRPAPSRSRCRGRPGATSAEAADGEAGDRPGGQLARE